MPNRLVRRIPFVFLTLLAVMVVLAGCGDQYRPIATPITKPSGNPDNTHITVVLSTNNGSTSGGMGTTIDVSGDTNIADRVVGVNPVTASFASGLNQVYVANAGCAVGTCAGDPAASIPATVSLYSPILTTSVQVNTISLPAGTVPASLTAFGQFGYLADSANSRVVVLNSATGAVQTTIGVGPNPINLALTVDGSKLYAVNQGNDTMTVINTVDFSVARVVNVGANPVASLMRSDNGGLYVVNQGDNTLSVVPIDTDAAVPFALHGTGPTQAVFENTFKRIYVNEPGSGTIEVLNGANLTPVYIGSINSGNALAITVLADGSRVYALNKAAKTVSVYDTSSFLLRKTIPVGNNPVAITSSADGAKVYVVNQDDSTVTIIRTSDDTVPVTLPTGAPHPTFAISQ